MRRKERKFRIKNSEFRIKCRKNEGYIGMVIVSKQR